MLRKRIEEMCPTIDLYNKSPKECWVLGFEAALKSLELGMMKMFENYDRS